MKRKRELTAWEEQQILDRDPKYQAMMAEKKKRWAEEEAMLRRNETPLVAALTAMGWPEGVTRSEQDSKRTVWDFVNTTLPYPHLLKTLAEHIVRPYDLRIKEGIARALAVREARDTYIPRVLLNELKRMSDPKDSPGKNYRWALINTLVLIGDPSMSDEVGVLVQDPRYASVKTDLYRLAKALHRDRRTNRRRQPKS